MRNSYSSIRMFESPFLERFSHVHPILPLVIWGPVAGYSFWKAVFDLSLPVGSVLAVALLGLLFWTLAEYLLHRFVFHFAPIGPKTKRMVFLFHGIHHDDPNDPTRLVMPPVPALVLAVIFYNLFRWVWGPEWVFPFFGAFVIGYLCYDYIHFSVHFFKPKTAVGRYLKKYHMDHHFIPHGAQWGVSQPLWDYVFGTVGYQNKKAKK